MRRTIVEVQKRAPRRREVERREWRDGRELLVYYRRVELGVVERRATRLDPGAGMRPTRAALLPDARVPSDVLAQLMVS